MMLCEIVRHVGEDVYQDAAKLVLLDAIFYPVKIHVKMDLRVFVTWMM